MLNLYLYFDGTCRQALEHYARALNTEVCELMTFGDASIPVGDEHKGWVVHGSIKVGESTIMASDVVPGVDENVRSVTVGNNFAVSWGGGTSKEQMDRVFAALVEGEGGKVVVPLAPTSYSAYYGALVDPFGVKWMMNLGGPHAEAPK